MLKRRTIMAALALAATAFTAPLIASAQGYGGGDHDGGYGNGAGHPCSQRAGLFRVPSWSESEDGGWNGIWTFTSPTSMSAQWTNNQTGRHRRAGNVMVSCRGRQVIISRPGLGNYVATIAPDGWSGSGTLSWSSGDFSIRANR